MIQSAIISGATSAVVQPVVENLIFNFNNIKSSITKKINSYDALNIANKLLVNLRAIEYVKPIFQSERISLRDFYYPSKIKLQSNSKGTKVDYLKQISEDGNIIIFGTVGQGKSMLMRYLAINEINSSARIPLFIELRYASSEKNVVSLIIDSLEKIGFSDVSEDVVSHLLKNGDFSIFLDGIDEIKRANILDIKNECSSLMNKFKKTRFVFSSRPGSLSQLFISNSNLFSFYISNIQKEDIPNFLMKMGRHGEHLDFLLDAIEKSPSNIKELLNTPLMLTLLNNAFGGSAAIPNGLQEFYNSLFYILVSRHDLDKERFHRERATMLSNSDLQRYFECFSFLSKQYGIALNEKIFNETCEKTSKVTKLEVTTEGFRTDITENICLMMPDGIHTTYIHKSIQEFFSASYISSIKNEQISHNVYRSLWENAVTDWSTEIEFLKSIDSENYNRFYLKPIYENFLEIVLTDNKIDNKKILNLMNSIFHQLRNSNTRIYFHQGGRYNPKLLKILENSIESHTTDPKFFEQIIHLPGVKSKIFTSRSLIFKKSLKNISSSINEVTRALTNINKKIEENQRTAEKYILGLSD